MSGHEQLIRAFEQLSHTITQTEPLAVVLAIKMPREILWPNGETAQSGYICYGTNTNHPADLWVLLGDKMHLGGRANDKERAET